MDIVKEKGGEVPIFGVCLGLQAIGVAYGGVVGRADELLHGKTSQVFHEGAGVLAGLPSPFTATRYHSLAIAQDTVPDELQVTARTEAGVIMAARHRDLPVEGVQFHPESVLTEGGHRMLANWLAICGDPDAVARSAGLAPIVSSTAEKKKPPADLPRGLLSCLRRSAADRDPWRVRGRARRSVGRLARRRRVLAAGC